MAAKRKLEFAEYSKVEEAGVANIQSMIMHLSPGKKSRKGNNYFHGQVCDGVKSMRLIGFCYLASKGAARIFGEKNAVEIWNCQIKKSNRDSDKKEVIMKGATKICASMKEFDVSVIEFPLLHVDGMFQSRIVTCAL